MKLTIEEREQCQKEGYNCYMSQDDNTRPNRAKLNPYSITTHTLQHGYWNTGFFNAQSEIKSLKNKKTNKDGYNK